MVQLEISYIPSQHPLGKKSGNRKKKEKEK